jgi:acyl-CoA thioesterase I
MLICSSCSVTKFKNKETTPAHPSNSPVQDQRPVIVAFGNSLTAGQGVDSEMNYPAKLQAKIDAAGYHHRVVNAGVSGEITSQGLDRLQSVCDFHPAVVIIEFGANDGLRGLPIETTRQNLAAIIKGLKSTGAKLLLAGMLIPPDYGPQYTSAFRGIFPSLTKEYSIALIPFFLDGIGGRPEFNQEDGIHPTAEGYDIVAENVWRVLRPLL